MEPSNAKSEILQSPSEPSQKVKMVDATLHLLFSHMRLFCNDQLSKPDFGVQWGPMGSKKLKNWAKSGKPTIQETLHKSGLGLMLMGFW